MRRILLLLVACVSAAVAQYNPGGRGAGGGGNGLYAPSASYSTAVYFPAVAGAQTALSTETPAQTPIGVSGTYGNLCMALSVAPGAGKSVTATFRDNAASTASTVTVSNTSTSGCDNHTFQAAANDLLDVQVTGSGTPSAAAITLTWTIPGVQGPPGATGSPGPAPSCTGIVTSNGSTAACVTAPAGTVVGTSDAQTLTNKTVDGVSPTTMGFVDPTSSIQTQLNALAPLASPTFTGTVAMPAPTFNTITGSTQCLHVNTSGVVSGTGSDCGSGSGSGTGNAAKVNAASYTGSPALTCGSSTAGTVDIFAFTGPMTANFTPSGISNCTPGQIVVLELLQSSGGTYTYTPPTGWDAAAVAPGTSASVRTDIVYRAITSSTGLLVSKPYVSAGPSISTPVAFSTLPSCSATWSGAVANVSDSATNTQGGTITGSGSNVVIGFCNGTNWIVVSGVGGSGATYSYHDYGTVSTNQALDLGTYNAIKVTANSSTFSITVSANPSSSGAYISLKICNNTGVTATFSLPTNFKRIGVPWQSGTCYENPVVTWNGTNYEGQGLDSSIAAWTSSIADPGTGACVTNGDGTTMGGCDFVDSTAVNRAFRSSGNLVYHMFQTGVDANPDTGQVTATHLASALPLAQGGTAQTSVPGSSGNFIYNNSGAYGAKAIALGDLPTFHGSCTEVWGGSGTSFALTSGDDAIVINACYNDSGGTRTITAVKCLSDNASNTTTVNPTFGSAGTGTTILSGALTCGSSNAMSSSGTVSNASWTTGTGIAPAMGGTLTGTHIVMIVEYSYAPF